MTTTRFGSTTGLNFPMIMALLFGSFGFYVAYDSGRMQRENMRMEAYEILQKEQEALREETKDLYFSTTVGERECAAHNRRVDVHITLVKALKLDTVPVFERPPLNEDVRFHYVPEPKESP